MNVGSDFARLDMSDEGTPLQHSVPGAADSAEAMLRRRREATRLQLWLCSRRRPSSGEAKPKGAVHEFKKITTVIIWTDGS